MARGWESKSVEAQQDEVAAQPSTEKPRLTREEAAMCRAKESLRLALQSVLRQLELSRDERRCASLEQARADLERKLQKMVG
jgi:hypothetical protein